MEAEQTSALPFISITRSQSSIQTFSKDDTGLLILLVWSKLPLSLYQTLSPFLSLSLQTNISCTATILCYNYYARSFILLVSAAKGKFSFDRLKKINGKTIQVVILIDSKYLLSYVYKRYL
jgi:hypothetical protein